jgi:hypothetical protein
MAAKMQMYFIIISFHQILHEQIHFYRLYLYGSSSLKSFRRNNLGRSDRPVFVGVQALFFCLA